MTTLDDLQKAIARVEEYRAMPLMDQLRCNAGFCAAEVHAWKTAFEWLNELSIRSGAPNADANKLLSEYDGGMLLIGKL